MEAISLVIQGPVGTKEYSQTEMLLRLANMRKLFPHSEIILSTWRLPSEIESRVRQHLSGLDIRLIQSCDPGALEVRDGELRYATNINRLLVSTRAGLDAVTRPLTIKLRSDSYLSTRAIVSLLERYVISEDVLMRDENYSLFRRRVLTASWVTRDARGSLPYLFHPGDIFLAGRTEDIRLFFSAPLVSESLYSPASTTGLWSAWRYVPEQWLWVNAIKRRTGETVFKGNFENAPGLVSRSENYFLANFIPFSASTLGFHWPKYWKKYPGRGLFSMYSHRKWLNLYAAIHGKKNYSVLKYVVALLTSLWRAGYILRAWLLQLTLLRRIVFYVFARRE